MLFDFLVAKEAVAGTWEPEPASIVVDPDPFWFKEWVDRYLAALERGENLYLAVDIETPRKIGRDEGDLEADDSYEILRINFSYNPNEGVTVPWTARYLQDILRLLRSTGTKAWWNYNYDIPRLAYNNANPLGLNLDFMWGWHLVQSDLPRGLGYVAPFYSRFGPWKHLSASDPGRYAAIDAVQTLRIAFGVTRDLKKNGQWEIFLRHVTELDKRVLDPAHRIGIEVDTTRLAAFKLDLQEKEERLAQEVGKFIPHDSLPLHPKDGWKRKPEEESFAISYSRGEKSDLKTYTQADIEEQQLLELTKVCLGCGAVGIAKTHTACKKEGKVPEVVEQMAHITRYYVREPFNPNSADQIRAYALKKGDALPKGKKSKSGKATTDKKVLSRLAKKDKFYKLVLDYREVQKVKGTYAEGTERRLKSDRRLHPRFLHKPSTLRLSCVNPNLTNVVADRGGSEGIASGYRACIVARQDSVLIEADFSGIEAVETGWFAGDPNYIRLAKLGVHANLASHLIGKPADLGWSDDDLAAYFKTIKEEKRYTEPYNRAKRVVHGTNYGLTPRGMVNNYPELFTISSATATQALYFDLCPRLKDWQDSVRRIAARQNYLGGKDHPFHYKHWFWAVVSWDHRRKEWVHGEDSKRVVAFYPQSTSAGVLKEAVLRLYDRENYPHLYIGDMFDGDSPIRALIHDSILLEVPKEREAEAIEKVVASMSMPIMQQPNPPEWHAQHGTHLQIGVAVKAGYNWRDMYTVDPGKGVAYDTPREEEEDDEVDD
jgi:DNA polymerase I-like protein with 3'-5' exonuclease and polymerase domains